MRIFTRRFRIALTALLVFGLLLLSAPPSHARGHGHGGGRGPRWESRPALSPRSAGTGHHWRRAVVVGPVLVLPVRRIAGTACVHPASAGSVVLVLLPAFEGLLSDRSELRRTMDPSAPEEPASTLMVFAAGSPRALRLHDGVRG